MMTWLCIGGLSKITPSLCNIVNSWNVAQMNTRVVWNVAICYFPPKQEADQLNMMIWLYIGILSKIMTCFCNTNLIFSDAESWI
jgi:hypothetical protein